ncbi:hypothetical protein BX600DRAFT_394093 [Xylariales sp. PMI_506]|nr:hypothetical protein BX600DRAFT_394093 [Xylariales sp. PMI_506]
MTSMVSEYIIRPALQQVRRFSRSSNTAEPEPSLAPSPHRKSRDRTSSHDDVISETEEDSYLQDEGEDSVSSPLASSPSCAGPHADYGVEAVDRLRDMAPTVSHLFQPAPFRSVVPEDTGLDFPTREEVAITGQPELENTAASLQTLHDVSIGDFNPPEVAGSASPAPDRSTPLPEDDGMSALRRRILEVQARDLPTTDKARHMHRILMEGYMKSHMLTQTERPLSPTGIDTWEQKQAQGRLESFKFWQDLLGESPAEKFVLSKDDIRPSFAPLKSGEDETEYRPLGCEHYKRNVKSQCSTCGHWYICRFCHDKAESHPMVSKDTKHMLCMFCGLAQKVGESCAGCGESAAMYYCSTCKLWNNDPSKSIYHCNDCGICRVGRGLGKDFFHCKTCNACLAISLENSHRCIERLLDCDCPICGEYMFNTPKGICHMKCGHALHRDCWDEHIKHAYKCPICNKSVVNMETQFRRLDLAIEVQPMPEKFQDTRAVVLCNDCSAKTTVKYHWLGLKCAVCQSYNTSQLQILGQDAGSLEIAAASVPDPQPESVTSSIGDLLQQPQLSNARDIPRRRRHSSNLMQLSTEGLDREVHDIGSYVVQDRLARSVSPVGAGYLQAEMDDSDEDLDIIGFWSRVPRSIKSNEDDEEDDSEDDAGSSGPDDMEDEEDEEDEISLFGHR